MKRKLAMLLSLVMLFTSIVPFSFSVSAATNASPTVLPALREWTGGTGKFTPNSSTAIVYAGGVADEQIALVQGFFADMLGLDLAVKTSGTSNAIIFKIDASACNGEDEGYDIVATTSSITITAKTKIGLLYGGISVVQSVYADGYFPVGTASDWPAYVVRSGAIDVARTYMPMADLFDATRYMAWYKLNEVHVHINDNGKNGYDGFRLESDIPGLTSQDGYYTKEEYRQYQRDAAKYGVTVITEFDSPHHSRCYSNVNIDGWTPKLLTSAADGVDSGADGRALDITDERTVQFILDLFTEYLGGDDPVILNDTVHVGMDEYPKLDKYSEAAEAYINRVIKHVNDLGYTARFWSSFGSNGFLEGATLDAGLDFESIYWDSTHSGQAETLALGGGIINYLNGYLYVVPGWNNQSWESFEDLMTDEAMQPLWTSWQVNQWSRWAAEPDLLASDDPGMLGASFTLWNDFGSAWIGLTHRDVLDRLRNITCFMAEKCWCGDDTGTTITYANFKSRLEKLGMRAGDVDIFHRDLPDGGINIDFENSTVPSYVTMNGTISGGEFVLDGTSYISLPDYEYVGMPNTLTFEITLDEYPTERAYIFQGSERTYQGVSVKSKYSIYVDPDGSVGFESLLTESDDEYGYYDFAFDGYVLPLGEKTKLTFTCTLATGKAANGTTLIVDGKYAFECVSSLADKITSEFSVYGIYSTLDIPLAKIGLGVKGKLDNIVVKGEVTEIPSGDNVALNKSYTTYELVDGVVTNENKISRLYSASLTDGEADENAPATNVTNPITGTANCNDGKWFGFFDNEWVPDEENCSSGIGYIVIDLGSTHVINKIRAHVETVNAPASVKAYVSADGETYTSVGTLSGTSAGSSYWISTPASANGRYVKLEVDLTSYWALLNEVEVYGGAVAVDETVEHIAIGKTVTDLSGKAPLESSNGVFKFGNVLVDGKAESTVDVTDKSWFAFQRYHNCTNGVGAVVIDLGSVETISTIKLHLANSNGTFTLNGATATIDALAPVKVEAFLAGEDGVYTSAGTFETKTDANIIYWTELDVAAISDSDGVDARYVKIEVTVDTSVNVPYVLMDEIAVFRSSATGEEHVCEFTGAWYSDENNHWQKCSCGETSAPVPHDEGEWETVEAATETTDGKKELHCTVCDKLLDEAVIPATGENNPGGDDTEKELRGDVDGDGEITASDYLYLKRIYFGTTKYSAFEGDCEARCDVDANGTVEASDYLFLKRAYFGLYNINPEYVG